MIIKAIEMMESMVETETIGTKIVTETEIVTTMETKIVTVTVTATVMTREIVIARNVAEKKNL